MFCKKILQWLNNYIFWKEHVSVVDGVLHKNACTYYVSRQKGACKHCVFDAYISEDLYTSGYFFILLTQISKNKILDSFLFLRKLPPLVSFLEYSLFDLKHV